MIVLLLLLIPELSALQPFQDASQAERLFDNAQTFMSAGKYKEALADFENVIASHSSSPFAPKALLAVGNYYLDVEGDHVKALSYFARIQSEYGQSSQAPAAYYYKAQIVERQGEALADLETAVADLIRMSNLYPDNPWESGAFFLLGKLCMRLSDFEQSLTYLQRLEFAHPKSPFVAPGLLLSAKAAFLMGHQDQAALILARLQAKFPQAGETAFAQNLLRLLDRGQQSRYEVDRQFFGATPKRFPSPTAIGIGWNDAMGIRHSKGVAFSKVGATGSKLDPIRDLTGFCRDRNGGLVLATKTRVFSHEGDIVFTGLSAGSDSIKDIRAAAIDSFGRLFVVEGGARDVLAFTRDGKFIKALGINRARLVRSFGSEVWVLPNDAATLVVFDGNLGNPAEGVSGLNGVIDFQIDLLGNIYVLSQKGSLVQVFGRDGRAKMSINLKSGEYPLKQSQALAVDASGALYLTDRRGGAVYRLD